MAIVKNRFDLRLLNYLVEKTGGVNEAINHYAQLISPATLGTIYCEKFPMNDLNDDELLVAIEIASTLSYFEVFKQCDIFLTGEMMDWYHRMMNFDNHIASIRRRATLVDGYLDTLDLFNITWTLWIIDWQRRSGRATSPELGEKIISFLESLPKRDSGVVVPFATTWKFLEQLAGASQASDQILAEVECEYKEIAVNGFLTASRNQKGV